ncbi:MAG: hypothetical protein ACYC3Q_01190 [Gemmatimonadaceae bacterium]
MQTWLQATTSVATKLKRAVRRETALPRHDGGAVIDRWIVTVDVAGVTLREWHRHSSLPTLPWSRHLIASQIRAAERRRERALLRAERRARRRKV